MGNEPSAQATLESDIDAVRAARTTQMADDFLNSSMASLNIAEGPECVYITDLPATNIQERQDDFGARKATLFGSQQPRSLIMHAKGDRDRMVGKTYNLGGTYGLFAFTVSIDDSAQSDGRNKEFGLCKDSMVFRVLGDDTLLWTSNPINSRNHAVKGKVDAKGVQNLRLEVHCPSGNAQNSFAVWVDPRLFVAPGVSARCVVGVFAAEVCVCGYLQAMVDSRLIRPVNDIDQMVRNLHHAGDLEKKGEGFMDGWSERCTTPPSCNCCCCC